MGFKGSGGRMGRVIGRFLLAVAILLIAANLSQATLISPTIESLFKFAPVPHKQLDYAYFAEHPPVLSLDEKSVLLLSTFSTFLRLILPIMAPLHLFVSFNHSLWLFLMMQRPKALELELFDA